MSWCLSVNADLPPAAGRAYDFLYRLVTEVGPRPAGSPAEQHAQELLAEELDGWGYRINRQSFSFPPRPAYFPFYLFPALIFPIAAWLLPLLPWLSFFLPLLAAGLPELADGLA